MMKSDIKKFDDASYLIQLTFQCNIQPNDIFFNKMIDFYSKNNLLSLSQEIFEFMLKSNITPTLVTYNTLIDCYFKHR